MRKQLDAYKSVRIVSDEDPSISLVMSTDKRGDLYFHIEDEDGPSRQVRLCRSGSRTSPGVKNALLDAFKILWPAQVLKLEYEGDEQRNFSISDFWSNGEHYRGTIPLIEKQIDEPNDDLVSIDYLTGKREVIIEGITRGIG